MSLTIAALDKGGADVTSKIIEVLGTCTKASSFGIANASKVVIGKKLELIDQRLASPVVTGFARSKYNKKAVVMRKRGKTVVFEGVMYTPKSTAVLEGAIKSPKDDAISIVKAFMGAAEGDFSLIVTESDRLVVCRDSIGVEPLYYGENGQLAALASNRKALWCLGINFPKSFPPGNLAVVNHEGFHFQPVKVLNYSVPTSITLENAAEKLQKLLEQSVRLRVKGVQEVAVAFSGGLDSSIVAFLAKKCGVKVQLVHVSLENQPETEDAWRVAEELDLPLQVHLFKETDIEEVIDKVIELIEEPNPLKASIGVPFYWVAKKAAEAGFRVLLAGQGADELFGGYQRYVNEYLEKGEESVRRTMYHDVARIHESNIERDKKICKFHDVELRLPFASYQIAEFALSLPVELKFDKKVDSLRKVVLRKTAQCMGLSEVIFGKPKKAVQYSTGVTDALKRIAKRKRKTLAEYVEGFLPKVGN